MKTSDSVSFRLARQSDSTPLCRFYAEWLSSNDRGRLVEIRKAIKLREIIVASVPTGKVVGFIHGIIHTDPISCGPLLFITSFYVIPKFRNKGVGSRLIDLIIKKSRIENQIKGIEISTSRSRALKLYKRYGFRQFRGDFGEIFLNLELRNWENFRRNKEVREASNLFED